MSIWDYIKDRWTESAVCLMVLGAVSGFGILVGVSKNFLYLMGGFWILTLSAVWGLDYLRKCRFYRMMQDSLKCMDKKYLLPEVLKEPGFLEGKILYETLREMTQSMNSHVREYRRGSDEYKEYIEMWIHEIKIPIATGKMILENHPSPAYESLEEELDRIDACTEQALYYARSNYVEKDYMLKKITLEEIVHQVIRKNKKNILGKKVAVNLHDLNTSVYSDGKWMTFILNQILDNSLKYVKETHREIEWFAREKKERTELHLRDNGIGIRPQDLGRVFEKGFTGENGRQEKKSTGIGLYLCKKLCEKMGHGIHVDAEENIGCEVVIIFPRGSMTGF